MEDAKTDTFLRMKYACFKHQNNLILLLDNLIIHYSNNQYKVTFGEGVMIWIGVKSRRRQLFSG